MFSPMSSEGTFPSFVRKGPLAWIWIGLLSAELPLTFTWAVSLRSALFTEVLTARFSSFGASPLLPPPPQEETARAPAANGRRRTAATGRRRGERTTAQGTSRRRTTRNFHPSLRL